MDYYDLIYYTLTLFFGLFVGYISNPVHRAKVMNLFGMNKMVVFMAGDSPQIHPFVVDRPIGETQIKVKYKNQEFMLIPNPALDSTWKNVVIGFFDPKDGRQLPLQAYVRYQNVLTEDVDKDGNRVWKVFGFLNETLLGKLHSPAKLEYILTTLWYAAKLKARQDTKGFEQKIEKYVLIVLGITVLALIVTLYNVSLTQGALTAAREGANLISTSNITNFKAT